MHLENVGLQDRPLRLTGSPVTFIQYQSQKDAFTFLRRILLDDKGVGLLNGPELSGKSTLVRQFIQEMPADQSVAFVDGTRLKTADFLLEVLAQFGYEVSLDSTEELLNMLSVVAIQQTRAHQSPVLILENLGNMYPSALCVLCKLAAIMIHKRYALRIILVSNRSIQRMLDSPGLQIIAERLAGVFSLGPLTAKETMVYLYTKLQSCGVAQPDSYFPVDVCDQLHYSSKGLPGKLDALASSSFDRTSEFPVLLDYVDGPDVHDELRCFVESIEAEVNEKPASVIVTFNGETLQEIELDDAKILIGRSNLSDVRIENQFISKHHALLIQAHDAILLVDLNSRNGTFVNSERVMTKVLRHEDIVSVGNHRIKIIDPKTRVRADIAGIDLADTVSMKNMADMREQNANRTLPISAVAHAGNVRD